MLLYCISNIKTTIVEAQQRQQRRLYIFYLLIIHVVKAIAAPPDSFEPVHDRHSLKRLFFVALLLLFEHAPTADFLTGWLPLRKLCLCAEILS